MSCFVLAVPLFNSKVSCMLVQPYVSGPTNRQSVELNEYCDVILYGFDMYMSLAEYFH
jgi:hypothetical protein